MHHKIKFVTGQVADALVTISGDLTLSGTAEWLSELVNDHRWRPGMKTLVNALGLVPHDMTVGEVESIATETVAQDDLWGVGFSAVFVADPAVYGLIRAWQAYTRAMAWETEVVYSRDEALAWLRSRPDPGEGLGVVVTRRPRVLVRRAGCLR